MGKSKILYDVEPDTTKVSKGTYMVVYHYFAAWKKLDEPTHFRMVKSITAKFLQIVKAQGILTPAWKVGHEVSQIHHPLPAPVRPSPQLQGMRRRSHRRHVLWLFDRPGSLGSVCW